MSKLEQLHSSLAVSGWAKVPMLEAVAISRLSSYYEANLPEHKTGTHVTMFQPDPAYRKAADLEIESVLAPYVLNVFPGYRILYGNFMVKEPGAEGRFPVHQDWRYVQEPDFLSYAVWIPLQDTDETNGTLGVLSGSHQVLTAPRGPFLHEPFAGISEEVRNRYGKLIPLKAGEALIWDHRLLHYSNANLSTQPRLAVTVIMVPEQAKTFHCFRRSEDPEDRCRLYEISREFFHHYQIGSEPKEFARELAQLPVPILSFDSSVAEALLRVEERGSDSEDHTASVAAYYDMWQAAYQQTYGDFIQAFRPASDDELICCWIEGADLKPGLRVLDLGCGSGGPAVALGKELGLLVDGLTISAKQAGEAAQRISAENLNDQIRILEGDYRYPEKYFDSGIYDRILFLESLGHAADPSAVIQASWKMLRPGGKIYIKDFYKKIPIDAVFKKNVDEVIEAINRHYCYNTLDLNNTLFALRSAGYEIEFVRKFRFRDDIGIRFRFEHQAGIDIFEGKPEFAPAEWLEILCIKPEA
jgi:SAM-dependent methyltransferase